MCVYIYMLNTNLESQIICFAGSFTPFGIAIDYSTDLLYYAAVLSGLTSASFIGVVDPYTGYDRQIITDLAAAYEVVLYPSKG